MLNVVMLTVVLYNAFGQSIPYSTCEVVYLLHKLVYIFILAFYMEKSVGGVETVQSFNQIYTIDWI